MKQLPNYGLYGEISSNPIIDGLHIESIADRSQLYDWEIKSHRHDDLLQILHIHKGNGSYSIGLVNSKISAPCLLITPRLSPHGFNFEKGIEGHVITIHHQWLQNFFQHERSILSIYENGQTIKMAKKSETLVNINQTIEQLKKDFFGSKPWRNQIVNALLASLIVMIAREANNENLITDSHSRSINYINQFKELLDSHYRNHFNIDFYANQIGITPTQLNRVCRNILGKSSLTVINQRLMLEAERDLLYTALSIKEIAYSLGFQDAAYFTRFFKKQAKLSPNDFRRSKRA
jgi:AraC family transcriptional activator of pobA